ncbi:MAG TPA: hypothetical protein PKV95_13785, partial [Anaerolineaceae bacterium]|nr:hypothetical protein [Anaerolineaceae bacterium]
SNPIIAKRQVISTTNEGAEYKLSRRARKDAQKPTMDPPIIRRMISDSTASSGEARNRLNDREYAGELFRWFSRLFSKESGKTLVTPLAIPGTSTRYTKGRYAFPSSISASLAFSYAFTPEILTKTTSRMLLVAIQITHQRSEWSLFMIN